MSFPIYEQTDRFTSPKYWWKYTYIGSDPDIVNRN